MTTFSEARFGIDILKVEVPVNMKFVEGSKANKGGESAYTKAEALRHFKEASEAATKPFIYLSAGVSDDVFRESLEYAAEAGANFSGVLCGRATWLEGLPIYAKQGRGALETWLADKGVRNIQMLNEVLEHTAKPWWTIYGGREAVAS
jgi:tagatose 1,6-diphosphate aldolase